MAEVGRVCMYWEPEGEEGKLRCRLCPHHCLIAPGRTGRCTVREAREGRLIPLTYGRVSSVALDPIEKKPLYHFYPGRAILSVGSWGCNLACGFCQNWEISHHEVPTRNLPPEAAVRLAQQQPGNLGLAFTYNEPLIWYEYVLDTSRLLHEAGLKSVLVTNGEIETEPLEELLPSVDALNVDVKAYGEGFYRELCKGPAAVPRRTVELAAGRCHVEVTNLLVTNRNDSEEDVRALVGWLASVGKDIPLHFSRYHPDHQLDEPPTPLATLQRAAAIGREQLRFVYVGNAQVEGGSDTLCPACGHLVVARSGFDARAPGLDPQGRCKACGAELNILTGA